jgi:hypothetical protein
MRGHDRLGISIDQSGQLTRLGVAYLDGLPLTPRVLKFSRRRDISLA